MGVGFHSNSEVWVLIFFFITIFSNIKIPLAYANNMSNRNAQAEVSLLSSSLFPSPSPFATSSDTTITGAAECLTNLTLEIESLQTLDTSTLGGSLCSAAGSECTSVTFISVSQKIVTVEIPSVTPGISTPSSVQKILSLYLYDMEARNRTVALSRILNAVRYASVLRQYEIQGVSIGGISKVYSRIADPITTYIGNTQQCLPHYWYLVFFIVLAPILGASYHYYYYVMKDREMRVFRYPPSLPDPRAASLPANTSMIAS